MISPDLRVPTLFFSSDCQKVTPPVRHTATALRHSCAKSCQAATAGTSWHDLTPPTVRMWRSDIGTKRIGTRKSCRVWHGGPRGGAWTCWMAGPCRCRWIGGSASTASRRRATWRRCGGRCVVGHPSGRQRGRRRRRSAWDWSVRSSPGAARGKASRQRTPTPRCSTPPVTTATLPNYESRPLFSSGNAGFSSR